MFEAKNKNEKIFIITSSEVEHIGSYSTKFDETIDKEMEYRNCIGCGLNFILTKNILVI